ncbi:MAG: hypothetical protein HQL17_07670 [Candidatus Omnitrophica bacterium]|nr:hypothetical protein [Candidatus Omnitrophota bacterium]
MIFDPEIDEVRQWCAGRSGYVRIPLLLFFAYIFYRHLTDVEYKSILGFLDLGIHELGHLIFAWTGQFLMVLGGTLAELAAPLAGMWNFSVQKDYFALTLCLGWLSTALFDVAVYAGDARTMALPLVTPFGADTVSHDWNYLLGEMGLLTWDGHIAMFIRVLACLSMVICLWGSGWIIWTMIRNQGKV